MIDFSKADLLCDPDATFHIARRPVLVEDCDDEAWLATDGRCAIAAWNVGFVPGAAVQWDSVASVVGGEGAGRRLKTSVRALRAWAPSLGLPPPCEACRASQDADRRPCSICLGSGWRSAGGPDHAIVMGVGIDRCLLARCLAILDVPDAETVDVSISLDGPAMILFDGRGWSARAGWRIVVAPMRLSEADAAGLADLADFVEC